ncbi:MAG TPA: M23 family metallopeptidase, partial [Candidatus Limnocylindria bacterium]|nr:M23 family metallopeptidase [Candidatus Limnocylindria bacterium]
AGKVWWDSVPHWGRVYDNHTGLDYPMALRSTIAAAKAGTVIDVEGGFGTQQKGQFGNFVLMSHSDGRRTLYYHLASAAEGGIHHGVGKQLAAGASVGLSGCSGICGGPHLHFELLLVSGQQEVPTDPMAHRMWTTWPGRVPFLAAYVRENNAGTEVVRRGQTISHWVEFRNTGGRTWRPDIFPGRVVLGTWNPPAHASPFRAADWPLSWMATKVDQASVPPNSVGRFTFGIRGGPAPGSYVETFNLVAQSVRWFDHARLGGFYVPIVVSNFSP